MSNTYKKSNEPDVDTFITENCHYINDLNRNPCDVEDQYNQWNVFGSIDFGLKRSFFMKIGCPKMNCILGLKIKKIKF
jgi:hypothetical protein